MHSLSRSPSRSAPSGAVPYLLFAVLLLSTIVQATAAQTAPDDAKTLFARPYIIRVMKDDPWMGGVWLATDGGLFFKDLQGGGMRIFSVSDGLPSAVIQDVVVGQNQVWVGTLAGAAVLDKASQQVHLLHNPDGSTYAAPTRAVFLDADEAWLGTDSFGLFRVDESTLVASSVPNPVNGSAFANPIYGIGAVGSELYVSAYGYGLVRWDRATGESWKYSYSYNHQQTRYLRLATSPQAVWVGTDGDGVMRLRRDTWALTEFATPQSTNALTVLAPMVAGDTVWMATTGGASRYDSASDSWTSWTFVPTGDSDSANDIALVDGGIYAATAAGSIAHFDTSSQTWPKAAWWDEDRMPSHNLILSCQMDGGRLLFGTGGGGASFYDPMSGLWAKAGYEPGDQGKIHDILVYRTATDESKRYFATGNGVTEMNKATGQYLSYYTDGRQGTGRGANTVRDVALDGNLAWFATSGNKPHTREGTVWNPGGVTRMDRQTHQMTFYGKSAGIADENVTRVVPDGDHVWIGMQKGGLDVLDKSTGVIQHVYTGQGLVNDILVRPDGVWLAAGFDGLLRLDPATLAVTPVPVLDGAAAWTLLDQGSTIWVGSAYKGLFALDPTSLHADHYGTGMNVDYVANCMVVHDGILYFGTGWGVERFDLAAHRFLPQTGRLPRGAAGLGGISENGVLLAIDDPAPDLKVDPGSTLTFAGHAVAPTGTQVSVRVGDGPWQPAEGVSQWSASVTIPGQVGPVTLSVRLQRDGAALAQVDRTVYAGIEASQAAALAVTAAKLHHTPRLEADANEPLVFQVDGAQGLPNATAVLEIQKPGADSFQTIAMVAGANGTFTAEVAPIGVPGEAEYRILAQWEGGSVRFPELFSPFGPTYPIEVNDLSGDSAAVVTGKTSFLMPKSGSSHFDVMVQNPGVRSALFNVSLGGVPVAWVKSVPASLLVGPSSSKALPFDVVVPAGQKEGRYALDLTLAPTAAGMSATHVQVSLLVPGSGAGHSRLSPLPVWPVLLAMLVVAALRRR